MFINLHCDGRLRSLMPHLATPAPSPRRFISRFSVRARIVAITLIPVVGFLANALTFSGGEREVDTALDTLRQATAAADASREFKGAVVTIQAAARSFADHPRPGPAHPPRRSAKLIRPCTILPIATVVFTPRR